MIESTETILVSREGAVARVTLNRPDVINAFNNAMRAEFPRIIRALQADEEVRAIVIHGAGDRGFCAGADVKEKRQIGSPVVEERERLTPSSWIEVLDEVTKPVIAALHGFCFGGGVEIALACDIRMASNDLKIGLTETRLGLIPGGGTQRATRLIGLGPALDLLITAERIDAERAYQLGLVTRLAADKDALLDAAMALASLIASRPPAAIAFAKEAAIDGLSSDLRGGLRLEKALFALLMGTEDRKEAAAAFAEKRDPHFLGH